MPRKPLGTVLQRMGELLGSCELRRASDAELLERFLDGYREDAFALLLERYGPMVLHVCRRVLPDPHDAEDAFQATFLLLVQKAGTIRKREALAAWLHGAARRLAVQLQKQNRARASRERKAAAPATQEPGFETAWRELLVVLEEELALLPANDRAPLVLCYLEGKTHEEAARQLGWPLGTVHGRVSRAREALRRRLARRGLTMPAALLGTVLATSTVDAVPPLLTSITLSAARNLAAGQALAQVAPASVCSLLEGTIDAMKLKVKFGLLLVLLTGVSILVAGGQQAAPERRVDRSAAATAADQPAVPAAEGKPGQDALGDPLPPGAKARLGTARLVPDGNVYLRPVFSPDSRLVALPGPRGTIMVWEVATGRLVHRLAPVDDGPQYGGMSYRFVFTPDGKKIVTAHGRSQFLVRDLATGKEEVRIENGVMTANTLFCVSPDGKRLITPGVRAKPEQSNITVWDLATGKKLASFTEHTKTEQALAFTPDGTHALLGTDSGLIHLWEVATGKRVRDFEGNRGGILAVAVSSDGKTVASAGTDGTIRLWDLGTGKPGKDWEIGVPQQGVNSASLAFADRDRRIVLGGVGKVRAWETATGDEIGMRGPTVVVRPPQPRTDPRLPRGMPLEPYDDRFVMTPGNQQELSPDGKVLATYSTGSRMQLWDVTADKPLHSFPGHTGALQAVAISSKGVIATGGIDRLVRLWDTKGKLLHALKGHAAPVHQLAFSHDGKYLASAAQGYNDRVVTLWDVDTGKEVRQFRLDGMYAAGLRFSPDGKELYALNAGGAVIAWDVASGKQGREVKSNGQPPQLSPDGRFLIAVDYNRGRVVFTDLATGKEARVVNPQPAGEEFLPNVAPRVNIATITVSPDSRFVLLGDYTQKTSLWETATGRRVRTITIPGYNRLGGWQPRGLQFSNDGRLLILADQSGKVTMIESGGGGTRRAFDSTHAGLTVAALAPDGRTLVTAGTDGTALVWDLTWTPGAKELTTELTGKELDALWADLGGDATKAEVAVRKLGAAPASAVPFLGAKLKAATAIDQATIDQYVADLTSKKFPVRKKAEEELARAGLLARPALEKALKDKPSLDLSQRVEALLKKIEESELPADVLQQLRGLEVLEGAASAESVKVIEALAKGAAYDVLTAEAEAALKRIKR